MTVEQVAHGIVHEAIQGALHFGHDDYEAYVERLLAGFGPRKGRGAYLGTLISYINHNSDELVELMMTRAFEHVFNFDTRRRLRLLVRRDHSAARFL